jgi:hypothetical protein
MKNLSLFFFGIMLFLHWGVFAQLNAEVTTAVDSTQVSIGEQINLTLQVKTDSLSMVEFSPEPLFLPFEIIEESPIDTLRAQQHYLYTKRYALIQFDSGAYWIPPQKIVVDGFSKFSDSIAIEVATVKVDTIQQPLFDIKPIQTVERSYNQLIKNILLLFVFCLLLAILIVLNRQYKKKKAALLEETPPFDRAIQELKALENELPKDQQEYKQYYSKLTDVVRRYLEEEADIDALESTSDELLDKLETLNNLKKVLQNADLVKFARSAPAIGIATTDRTIVEQVVIETKEALPAPTEEELAATAAFQRELERKRRKQKIQLIGISVLGLLVSVAVIAIAIYGFNPVKDTIFRYPTKVLLDGSWVRSQYGTPPVQIETPKVLVRDVTATSPVTIYAAGDPFKEVYTQLFFEKRTPAEKKEKTEEEQEQEARAIMDSAVARYEAMGATNLLVQNDAFSSVDGAQAFQLFGSMDLSQEDENIRCRFVSVIFPFEATTVELKIIYPKDDRYGLSIEEKILASLEIIKEL